MALAQHDINKAATTTQLGTRNDYCYLCAKQIEAKNEREFDAKFKALKGQLEGQPILKVGRTQGAEICICMDCIRKVAEENPAKK